jgi:hypothetical protein
MVCGEMVMEEAKLIELLLNSVAGPAAATVVALLCMGGFGWFMIKHLLPRQDRFIDEFVKESRANRKVFVDAVEIMGRRLDKVEENLDDIHKSMSEIKFILKEK